MVVFKVNFKVLIYAVSGLLLLCLLCLGIAGLFSLNQAAYSDINFSFAVSGMPESSQKKLAVVLEDFGDAREAVSEALALDADITVAVLPLCKYSTQDAQTAAKAKKEVILHLPMQSSDKKSTLKNVITSDMNTQALEKYMKDAIASVPGAVGASDHQGVSISNNMTAMRTILSQLKTGKMNYYLDSRYCDTSAPQLLCRDLNFQYSQRNVIIDGKKNEGYIKNQLLIAADIADKYGKAIAIGHVGEDGSLNTIKVIKEMLPELEKKGIEVVFVSKLFE